MVALTSTEEGGDGNTDYAAEYLARHARLDISAPHGSLKTNFRRVSAKVYPRGRKVPKNLRFGLVSWPCLIVVSNFVGEHLNNDGSVF